MQQEGRQTAGRPLVADPPASSISLFFRATSPPSSLFALNLVVQPELIQKRTNNAQPSKMISMKLQDLLIAQSVPRKLD
jgi:hypothetical protein